MSAATNMATALTPKSILHVRRFQCINPACPTVTFAERLSSLAPPAAQRTVRLNAALRDLALAFGGQAGSRQSARSAMAASGDTLLRRAHAATPPAHPRPHVLGIDDFAFQKGRVYGSILTDGETHAVADLLPDRSAETVTAWLATHPGVEIAHVIARRNMRVVSAPMLLMPDRLPTAGTSWAISARPWSGYFIACGHSSACLRRNEHQHQLPPASTVTDGAAPWTRCGSRPTVHSALPAMPM